MLSKLAHRFLFGFVALFMLPYCWGMVFSMTRSTSSNSPKYRKLSRTASRNRKKAVASKNTHRGKWVAARAGRKSRKIRLRPVDPTIGDNPGGEDPTIRRLAVEALGQMDGSVVVVDPSNGRILTIVNQKLALGTGYQPCSTFKLAVSLAGLSEGVFSKDSEFRCPYRGYLNLTDALAYSCNEYFQNVGERLGFERVKKYAQEFGFGELAGLNISGEHPGIFPSEIDDEWVRRLSSHGQFIEVTPLEMAAFVSAVANGGTLYYLQYPRNQEEIENFLPQVKRRLCIAKLLPDLKEGMSGSVTYGSGKRSYDPLEPVYGKTGSCSAQGRHLGWFVSYAGDTHPQLVVVVLLRQSLHTEGPFAAGVAGKIYRGLSQQKFFADREDRQRTPVLLAEEASLTNRNNNR